jgi:hypothetical protein
LRAAPLALALLAVVVALPAAAQIGRVDATRVLSVSGQAFDYRPNQFAELQAFAFGQDRPLFGSRRLVVSTELTPVILRQGTGQPGGKEWNAVLAGDMVVAWRGGPRGDGVGYRLELGSGLSYGIRRNPEGGTKFEFHDQGGASVTLRRGMRGWALGYRMVHFSNLALKPNPGITFHTLSFALEWYK